MMAAWYPFSQAVSIAAMDTTVLPLPTSPCSRRCMGEGLAMSPWISPITRFCASVSPKGRMDRNRLESSPSV